MPRPRVYDERRVTTAIRIPESLHEKLHNAAEQRDVSVNLLVLKAIDAYLERLVPTDEAVRAPG